MLSLIQRFWRTIVVWLGGPTVRADTGALTPPYDSLFKELAAESEALVNEATAGARHE